jgi:drug/metabolite transporter (DMT)-like permease
VLIAQIVDFLGWQIMIYFQLFLVSLIWGGGFIAGRVVMDNMEVFAAGFWRFAIATICLFLMTQKIEGKLPILKSKQLFGVIALGLSGTFIYNIFFLQGLKTVPASRASLIIGLSPVMIALISSLLFGDKLTKSKAAGIIISLFGVAIVLSEGNIFTVVSHGLTQGDLYLFIALINWTIYTLIGRKLMGSLSPLVASTYACFVGVITFALPALNNGLIRNLPQVSFNAIMGLLYLGILASAVAFYWYYLGIKVIGSAQAVIFMNFSPVFATILGAVILNEPITLSLVIGGILVLIGIYLTNQSS